MARTYRSLAPTERSAMLLWGRGFVESCSGGSKTKARSDSNSLYMLMYVWPDRVDAGNVSSKEPKSAREAVQSCEFVRDNARKAWKRARGGEGVGEGAGEMLRERERELESARERVRC